MWCTAFPHDEHWDQAKANDQRRDDVCAAPGLALAACEGEGDEDQSEGCDDEDDADDV